MEFLSLRQKKYGQNGELSLIISLEGDRLAGIVWLIVLSSKVRIRIRCILHPVYVTCCWSAAACDVVLPLRIGAGQLRKPVYIRGWVKVCLCCLRQQR